LFHGGLLQWQHVSIVGLWTTDGPYTGWSVRLVS
jgi:hypothetical protein